MPLYYLLVGRRMESVFGVHEYRRGFNAQSLDESPVALTTMFRMLLAGIATVVVVLVAVAGWCAFRFLKKKKPKGADENLVSYIPRIESSLQK